MTVNPFVIDTELRREPGNSRRIDTTVTLDERLGTDVIGIPAGGALHLDLLLESVMDGILVSGTVSGELEGECVRCLRPLTKDLEVEVTELYAYPDTLEEGEADDEEEEPVPTVEEDTIDLTGLIVDAVVPDLPFSPLCREDCEGLCPQCGTDLAENPGHAHEAPIDPRWAALSKLARDDNDE